MKNKFLLLLALVFALGFVCVGCSDDDDDDDPSVDLKYAGDWTSSTEQNVPVTFTISDVSGKAMVTSIALSFVCHSGSTETETYNEELCEVKDGTFNFYLYTNEVTYVEGTFTSDTTISGSFRVTECNGSQVTHTFEGTKN